MSDRPHQRTPLTAQALAEHGTDLSRQIALALEQPASGIVSAATGTIPRATALRDSLIAQRRAGSSIPSLDSALRRTNTILSLLSAVGYPEGPPQRSYLKQAHALALEVSTQLMAISPTTP